MKVWLNWLDWPTLQFVHIGYNNITQLGVAAFAEAVDNWPALTHLDLHCNPLGDVGAAALASCISCNFPALKTLDLEDCLIEVDGVTALAQVVWPALTHLYLQSNPLGDVGAAALASCISCNFPALIPIPPRRLPRCLS